MSPTRTIPYACHLHNPACPGTLNAHCFILDDSCFACPLLMVVETDSPLFLAYQVALQAFCMENLGLSRPVLPDQDQTKGESVIASGCWQCA